MKKYLILTAFAVLIQAAKISCVFAGPVIISNEILSVTISDKTGQVLDVSDLRLKKSYIVDCADIYTLSSGSEKGQLLYGGDGDSTDSRDIASRESRDTVTGLDKGKQSLSLQCLNQDFPWLTMNKIYKLEGNILSKRVVYKASTDTSQLFSVQSRVILDASVKEKGRYFFPMDDGYKMAGPGILENKHIKRDIQLNRSNAMVIHAMPDDDRVLAQYLYRINGKIAYCGWPIVPAFLHPDGWTTGLSCDFLSPARGLELESHITLVDGDARHFHLQYYSLSEFVAFRDVESPSWMKDVVLWAGGNFFNSYADPAHDRTAEEMYTYGLIRRTSRMLSSEKDLMYHALIEPTTTGDYPFTDPVPYYKGKTFDHTISLERYKEIISKVKATIPNLKVTVYTSRSAVLGKGTFAEKHPEWVVHDYKGKPVQGGSGLGIPEYLVDITAPGYQEYALDQYKRIIDTLGVDWAYMDNSPYTFVNWKYKRVSSTADWIDYFQKIHKICSDRNVFLWLNSGWTSALCSDIALFESFSIHQMEKTDWRKLAYMSFMAKLTKLRSSGNIVIQGIDMPYYYHSGGYGTQMTFFGGNFGSGMVPCATAFLRLGTELFDAVSVPLKVSPSWWSGETEQLEIGSLKKGDAFILPLIWHGKEETMQNVQFDTEQLGFKPGRKIFVTEMANVMPEYIDLTKESPCRNDVLDIRSIESDLACGEMYSKAIKFAPKGLVYLTVTEVPGFVYSVEEQRPYLLLPENKGVQITGSVYAGDDRYKVVVTNESQSAQIFLYFPDDWSDGKIQVNGQEKQVHSIIQVESERFFLVEVLKGVSTVTVSRKTNKAVLKANVKEITNPDIDTWQQVVAAYYYYNLDFKPICNQGDPVLELTLKEKSKNMGSFIMDTFPHTLDGGLEFSVYGYDDGSVIALNSDLVKSEMDWSAKLDFKGWKTFTISKEQWKKKRYIRFVWQPVIKEKKLKLRKIRLLEAEKKIGKLKKRKMVAHYVPMPPDMNSIVMDNVWDLISIETDFSTLGDGGRAGNATWVRACYTDKAIYFNIDNKESIVVKSSKMRRDGHVYNNSSNEIYINVNPKEREYFHFIFDSGANQYDEMQTKSFGADIGWDGKWRVVTSMGYNTNWNAKIEIPFSDLEVKPKAGDRWTINIGRTVKGCEKSSWSPSSGGWQNPDNFGVLEFGTSQDEKNEVIFYGGFDNTCNADFAKGDQDAAIVGKPNYAKGLNGQALVVNNQNGCSFSTENNIDWQNTTIEIYVMPVDWHRDDDGGHMFLTARSDEGLFSFNKTKQTCMLYIQDNETRHWTMLDPMLDLTWRPNKWHHVIAGWDNSKVLLAVDGEIFESPWKSPQPKSFGNRISLGLIADDKTPGNTAIDELRIYNRLLTKEEIEKHYQLFKELEKEFKQNSDLPRS